MRRLQEWAAAVVAAHSALPHRSESSFLHSDAILEELKAERDRRVSLEQRGIAVISLSGLLIALLLNASRETSHSTWPIWSTTLLLTALTSLVVAALFGLLCAAPRSYGGVDNPYLEKILMEYWDEDDPIASRRIGGIRIGMIQTSRRLNRTKAQFLRVAIVASATGITLASASVMTILLGRLI